MAGRRRLASDSAAAQILQTLQSYAIYCPNTPALRGTVQDPQMRPPVGLSGGGLAEAFQELRRAINDERLDDVFSLIDWVRDISATEAAGSLLSPSVARGKYVLKFTDRFMKENRNTLTAYDASEGALYVLFTAVLCLSPSAPRLFAVERNSDGHTCVRRVTLTDRLRKLNEQYPLSRLWMMGHLGAVPNV